MPMPSAPNPFSFLLPFSGSVWQDYHPLTNWFSPTIQLDFAGNHKIEKDVVGKVASYGKQLGRVIDVLAVMAEAAKKDSTSKEFIDDVDRLVQMKKDIEAVKEANLKTVTHDASEMMANLKKENPEFYDKFIRLCYNDLKTE
ncbi:MAG: hypothetical protein ABT940_00705 [Alphaproteobacteria bacterium]